MENHHAINGKSTISMAILNSYVKLPEGNPQLPSGKHTQNYGTSPFCSWVNELNFYK